MAKQSIELKVAGDTHAPGAAGALVMNFQEGKTVTIVAIGAGAVNQMTKACAIARRMGEDNGIKLVFIPEFTQEQVQGMETTGLRFRVESEQEIWERIHV